MALLRYAFVRFVKRTGKYSVLRGGEKNLKEMTGILIIYGFSVSPKEVFPRA